MPINSPPQSCKGALAASLPSLACRLTRAWDIGIGDYTSIWLFQRLDQRIRLVHYIQDCGEGLPHYVNELSRLRAAARLDTRRGVLAA